MTSKQFHFRDKQKLITEARVQRLEEKTLSRFLQCSLLEVRFSDWLSEQLCD